jgi:hypothetical protein
MKLRRALALPLAAALLVPFARFAAAQDAAAAAAAVAAATAGAPKTEAPKADAPKKEEAKPKKKKGGKGGKKKPEAESKYKSRALSENTDSHYRYDADGNPVESAAKKKAAAKAKKKSSDDPDEDKGACGEDAPCADKKTSEADSL